jgi:serine/threonine protein kinase/predicted negative regulator of RcsB-dependent stress response
MDSERNLLFGVVALQSGVVDADRLAETCADWVADPTLPLANLFMARGLMTVEEMTEVEKAVERELDAHAGDPHATLAATIDGRSLEVIREATSLKGSLDMKVDSPPIQGSHIVLGTLSAGEHESRERYTLTHLHAKGGMGRVWLARDTSLGRQIALKELRPDQAENSIVCSRFLYEAKVTAQLEHPGIVPVYELGEGDSPYYTMRFVKGRTLSEAIRAFHKKRAAGQTSTVEQIGLLTAFVSVCHAVAYAHSRGVIHRDLKGQNVVLGDFGEVMVLDWGLAKRVRPDQQANAEEPKIEPIASGPAPGAPVMHSGLATVATTDGDNQDDDERTLPETGGARPSAVLSAGANGSADQQLKLSSSGGASQRLGSGHQVNRESGAGPEGTMQGQLLGTPAYMAPEQAQGRHDLVDERTDVYGLGAILYEILTGRPPFIAPKTSEIIRKVCQDAPTPPRQIVETVTPGLEAVCLKAIRKVPAERYSSASELAQDVQRHLADEPVKAYPDPWINRLQRWGRQHRTLVTTLAGLLVSVTILSAIGFVLVRKEKKEAESQGAQARQAVQLLTKVADIGFEEQLDPLQREFLEDALQYYEQFTSRVAHDPAVRLEHGRVYQLMGDIERKLGKPRESENAYRKAIEMLEPLANNALAGALAKQSLARTRTLLGDLLVRHGDQKNEARSLYEQAIEVQKGLAAGTTSTAEDSLRLGQTRKSQGDLLRQEGKLAEAAASFDQAISVLTHALKDSVKQPEVRNDLALAVDARGWIHRESGEVEQAEAAFHRATQLLEDLVKEFPTVPRHREALARAFNSLALIEKDEGHLADAETHLRLELPLVDRLASDFPDRPEYSREFARTLMNLGNVMSNLNHRDEASRALRRAVEVFGVIAAKDPRDVQIQLDLAKCHNNVGELLRDQGEFEPAIAAYQSSCAIAERLVKEHPDQPRYREQNAGTLGNLALALSAIEPTKGEESFRKAIAIYDELVAEHKDNFDYRLGLARCLANFGPLLAGAKRAEQAEGAFTKALALVETNDAQARATEVLRLKTGIQINLGGILADMNRPDAEQPLQRALAIAEGLVTRGLRSNEDDLYRATAQHNLGDFYLKQKRLAEAEALLASAVGNFEKLAAASPTAIDLQSNFGVALATRARWFDASGKLVESRSMLTRAVDHQRTAVGLSKNGYAYRAILGEHLIELAKVNLKLGAYEDAARLALDVPKTVPGATRAQACYDSARILAKLVTLAGKDTKLAQADRDRLTRSYLGRTIVLLREAIDTSPTLAVQIKSDPDIKLLESQPEFKTIMNTLVNQGQ